MKEEDRRVKKTKKAITNALITLLQTKELHAITVKELTEIADIHRATFYVHYEDIYDLYQQTEDQVMESLSFILRKDAIHSYEAAYADLIVYVLENKEISKMLFGASAMKSFQ